MISLSKDSKSQFNNRIFLAKNSSEHYISSGILIHDTIHIKNLLPNYLVLNVIQGGQPWIFDQIPLLLDQFSHQEEVKYLKTIYICFNKIDPKKYIFKIN